MFSFFISRFKKTNSRFYIIITIICISLFTLSKILITNHFFLLKQNIKQINQNNNQNNNQNDIHNYNQDNNIIYVEPQEAFKEILFSGYFNNFNETDMKVRKCDNMEKCQEMYKNNLVEFNNDNKKELERLIKLCNEKINKYKSLYDITWKLCKTTKKLEEGMPHTHTDIIFLSDSFFRTNNDESKMITLIHEKLHVYQRKYKEKTEELYNKYNFSKVEKKKINLRRTNPDLDSYDYNYNGVLIYSEYKDNARSLRDVDTKFISIESKTNKEKKEIEELAKNGYQNEHPNEIFASIISEKIVNNNLNEKLSDYIK